MEWFNSFLTYLTSGVSFSHPVTLLVIFVIGAVSEVGLPLFFSVEILLFFIGYNNGLFSSQALLTILMLLLGRELGANVLYLISRILGSRFLDWLGKRSSRTLKAVERFKNRFNKKPALTVALLRLTPGLLQVPSIAGGLIRLRQLSFITGVAISSVINDFIIVLLGFIAQFVPFLKAQPKAYLLIGFTVLMAVVWVIIFFSTRHNAAKK